MSSFNAFPAGWHVKEIKDADITIIDGDRGANYPSKNEFTSEGYCLFLNTGNIKNDSFDFSTCDFITENKDALLRKGKLRRKDVVLTTRGTVGSVGFFHNNILYEHIRINSGMVVLRCAEGVSSDYCYHLFKSPLLKTQYSLYSSGAAQPQLPIKDLKRIKLPIPPLDVQEKIAAILSSYDGLIENNQRRIALLEKMAEEIYREWFVRLRFPGHEKVKKIKGMPDGWRDQKFGQFCQLQRGYDLTDAEVDPGPYPVIASTSIKTYHSQYKVEPPVITTGRSGSLGEVLFVNTRAWPHNTALYVKNFFGNSAFLVYYTLKNMRLENFNAGAGVPTLNRNHLNGIPIIVPSKKIQDQFDGVVSKLHEQTELLRNANQKLTASRDALLPRLISGKLSVENLDIQFPPGMEDHP